MMEPFSADGHIAGDARRGDTRAEVRPELRRPAERRAERREVCVSFPSPFGVRMCD